MSLLHSVYVRLGRSASGSEPTVDAALTGLDVLAILWRTGSGFLRGLPLHLLARRCDGPVLVGKGARVTHVRHLEIGRRVKIEELAEVHCLSSGGVQLEDGVTIGRGASIRPSSYYGGELGQGLRVGAGSALGPFSWIGASGRVEIGRNVLLGPRVVLIPENHVFSDPSLPIKEQGVERAGLTIEDDCWLGANVTVLAGVRIGRGSIVAAGAVVNRDVAPGSIVGGVPARTIRTRSKGAA